MTYKPDWIELEFCVVRGTGSASGARNFSDVGGTIYAQKPLFLENGIDLSAYWNGTINASISPLSMTLHSPRVTVNNVKWHEDYPAENFSFSDAQIVFDGHTYECLVYYPRPETKAAFGSMPPPSTIEVLAEKIPTIEYGSTGILKLDSNQVSISSDS